MPGIECMYCASQAPSQDHDGLACPDDSGGSLSFEHVGCCRVRGGSGGLERLFSFLFLIHDPGKTLVSTASRPAYMVITGKQASEQETSPPPLTSPRLILVPLGHTPSPRLPWRFGLELSRRKPQRVVDGPHQPSPGSFAPTPRRTSSCGLGGCVYLVMYVHDVFQGPCRSPLRLDSLLRTGQTRLFPPPQAMNMRDERREEVNSNDTCSKLGDTRARTTSRVRDGWIPLQSKQVLVTRCQGASHYPVSIFVCCISPFSSAIYSSCLPLFLPPPRKRARKAVGVRSSCTLSLLRPPDNFVDMAWWRLLWEPCSAVEAWTGLDVRGG